MPIAQFGQVWPQGVPVQVHGKAGDDFFAEDLPAAQELAAATAAAELLVYAGNEDLFADLSLDAYEPEATALLMERVQALLEAGGFGRVTGRGGRRHTDR